MNVKVYQMKDGEKYHGLRFRELPDDVNGVDLRDYDLVWDGLTTYPESNDIQILNCLFHKLNVGEKPISYRGHSLSVSDLVALEDRLYCCQSIGWKPVAVRSGEACVRAGEMLSDWHRHGDGGCCRRDLSGSSAA